MKTKSSTVSRRDFLKGAAVGAVGLATMGVLGGCQSAEPAVSSPAATAVPATPAPAATAAVAPSASSAPMAPPDTTVTGGLPWLGNEPIIADADIAEEVSADVVIVGCGLAGVAAARSAAEEGATVIAFEKASGPQCRSGEFAVINGDLEARWGRDNMNLEEIIDKHMDECSYRTKRMIMKKWADGSAEVFNWYIGATPDLYICDTTRSPVPDDKAGNFLIPLFHPLPAPYNYKEEKFPVFPTSVELLPSQGPVFQANMEIAVSNGAKPYYGHFVEKLIMENGTCVGVYARSAETGKYVKATATKGVVLASGDYMSNPEILDYYCPEVKENQVPLMWFNIDVEGKPTNTGDGLKLGAWVGAAIQQSHAPMIHHMGGGAGPDGEGVMGIAGFLQLDKHGHRVMNEDIPGQQMQNQIELLKDRVSYQLFDEGWKDQLQYMPAGHGVACYYDESKPQNNATYRNYKSQEKLDKAVEEGRALKANTLDELFSLLDIDKEAALASVERYNLLANNGYDEDFGKPASRLFPLDKPPYYAVQMGMAAMLVCIGGLESDENCHTFDQNRDIIPGLYVAGNIQGSRMAVQYPISLKGVSHALALYYGYIAGKNAYHQV